MPDDDNRKHYEQNTAMLGVDKGADMRDRPLPCLLATYCTQGHLHLGPCIELPPLPYERQAWDLKTPDPTGWRQVKCSRCGNTHAGHRSACPANTP